MAAPLGTRMGALDSEGSGEALEDSGRGWSLEQFPCHPQSGAPLKQG